MNPSLEADYNRTDPEDLEAAEAIVDHLLDGSHYQRQVDALRAMGAAKSAERMKADLAKQGIVVN